MNPYYEDDQVQLYLGDMREVLPALGVQADLIMADPPYGETSLVWDRWPTGWLETATRHARSMWCFGSMRMFGDHWHEYADAGWKLSQDIVGRDETDTPVFGDVHTVWQKNAGTGIGTDRFRRIHEHATHWYHGAPWRDLHHEAQREAAPPTDSNREIRLGQPVHRRTTGAHIGDRGPHTWVDDGTRYMTSVIKMKNLRGLAIHPTEKPLGLLTPLIKYACPEGGVVLDPFAGSGSTLDAARQAGRRAIGVEVNEAYAEAAARRLSALTLPAA